MKKEPKQPSNEPRPEPTRLDPNTREKLSQFLQEHNADPMLPVYAEMRFYWSGLTSILEETGILEKDENPNPIDIRTGEAKHEQWWADHPEVSEAFDLANRKREEQIKLLYIGTFLGRFLRRIDPEPKRINDSK